MEKFGLQFLNSSLKFELLYDRSEVFIFHKRCPCPYIPCFWRRKKAKHEAEEPTIACRRWVRCVWEYLKLWLLLLSAQAVGSCVSSEQLEKDLMIIPLERSQEPPQCPVWSLIHASSMGMYSGTAMRWELAWGEGIYMSVSGCGPNSEFPARLLPSWSVSGNCIDPAVMLRQMLAQVRVWAVAAYKYLKYLLWDITHTEKWPCPGVVQACMVVT